MTIDRLINLLVSITLIEMMLSIGLSVTFGQALSVVRDWRQVTRAGVANYVLVPAATVGLLLLFRPNPMVAVGFLVVAVCPGAPYGPPFTALAKGNTAVAVGLMVVLAGSSAILAPLLLPFLLPIVAGNEPLKIDAVKMVLTLLFTQLLPLFAGLLARKYRPELALKLQKPANRLSAVLNLAVLGSILAVQFQTLREIRPTGLVGMLVLWISILAAGTLLGGPGRDNRVAMAITTSVRNVGVGLVIATGSFPGTAAVTAVLAYGLLQTIMTALGAVGWGWLAPSRGALMDGPTS